MSLRATLCTRPAERPFFTFFQRRARGYKPDESVEDAAALCAFDLRLVDLHGFCTESLIACG
jgi:hypothetical protein